MGRIECGWWGWRRSRAEPTRERPTLLSDAAVFLRPPHRHPCGRSSISMTGGRKSWSATRWMWRVHRRPRRFGRKDHNRRARCIGVQSGGVTLRPPDDLCVLETNLNCRQHSAGSEEKQARSQHRWRAKSRSISRDADLPHPARIGSCQSVAQHMCRAWGSLPLFRDCTFDDRSFAGMEDRD